MNLAVVFGGVSCEHDISIITACQVMNVLKEKYEIIPIYIDKNGIWRTGEELTKIETFSKENKKSFEVMFSASDNFLYIKRLGKFKKFTKIDMVFLALHGKNGEDGSVSSLFELNGIPYANAGICSSAVACDKCIFKDFLRGNGISNIKGFNLKYQDFKQKVDFYIKRIAKNVGFPLIIKPANLGSSIGIEIVESEENLKSALIGAFTFDSKVLIEQYLEKIREINVAIYTKNNEYIVSELEEPIKTENILSFKDKYENGSKLAGMVELKRQIPAKISDDIRSKIIGMALKCYKALGLFGICRFDFIVDKNNKVYLNEVNTIPGSYAFYLFEPIKKNFQNILDDQIEEAKRRNFERKKITTTFKTNTLKDFKITGSKGKF